MVAISIMASTSSEELKKGKRRERIVRRITPADHISISAMMLVLLCFGKKLSKTDLWFDLYI